MEHVESFSDIQDFHPIAVDLAPLLQSKANDDIAPQFPDIISKYAGQIDVAIRNFQEAQGECEPGVQQQSVAHLNRQSVGLGGVKLRFGNPKNVPTICPNMWGFICNPYRGQGIGRLLLAKNLEIVDEQFGGMAWTRITKTDGATIQAVESAGLQRLDEEGAAFIYTYGL